ncbi:MAG: hypothetical protein LUQ54_02275 [Methanoregula sp.]|nr:hypothetical protein [Methanoregula sp.]
MTNDRSKEPEKGQENARTGFPDRTLIIAGIALVIGLIAVIAIALILQPPPEKGTVQSPIMNNFTKPEPGLSEVPAGSIPKTVRQEPVPTVLETPGTQAKAEVDFTIQSGVLSSCGLTCRQMDATLTNSGYSTAHNVCIMVSMHNSRNEIISLNGNSVLKRCVGDLAGGRTVTEAVAINADCGPFASRCLGETLTLQTQVQSDEKVVRFPDQVISV